MNSTNANSNSNRSIPHRYQNWNKNLCLQCDVISGESSKKTKFTYKKIVNELNKRMLNGVVLNTVTTAMNMKWQAAPVRSNANVRFAKLKQISNNLSFCPRVLKGCSPCAKSDVPSFHKSHIMLSE